MPAPWMDHFVVVFHLNSLRLALTCFLLSRWFFFFRRFFPFSTRCCKPEKALSAFTKCDKLGPIFMYMFCGLVAGICSLLGLLYLLQVQNAVNGLVCDVEVFRSDTSLFLDNITLPLGTISNQTATTVAIVSNKVGNASLVKLNFNLTLTALTNTSTYLQELSPVNNMHWAANPSRPEVLPCNCSFCEPTSLGLLSTKNELESNIGR